MAEHQTAGDSLSYKIVTYVVQGRDRAGIVIDAKIFDAEKLSGKPEYGTVPGILADWDAADASFAGRSGKVPQEDGIPLESAVLKAPLCPGQIYGAGGNYQDHISGAQKVGMGSVDPKAVGERPWFFVQSSRNAVVGQDAVIPIPENEARLDWEIELALIIGREAFKVSAADARDYVAGYAVSNDLSARGYAIRSGFDPGKPMYWDWYSQKCFDGSCPLGPWIVPARYVSDPQSLDMKLWVDGELMQNSNTRNMIFPIGELIEEATARTTLYPGDVILTGTPSGTGLESATFIKPGSKLRLFISEIGELRHSFV
ncbi:fumarylacetoacetate hydrolase family protein [Sphingobium sp.]|uniref:fumarylacetoacetate hydrolase family protein n=1 Tax=Sphingobium sp. TaxID=1912891 RepID=UPI0028BF337B|nr:fumarylacetoacetate hydrolase family protein [Sphingobium sp.]